MREIEIERPLAYHAGHAKRREKLKIQIHFTKMRRPSSSQAMRAPRARLHTTGQLDTKYQNHNENITKDRSSVYHCQKTLTKYILQTLLNKYEGSTRVDSSSRRHEWGCSKTWTLQTPAAAGENSSAYGEYILVDTENSTI